MQTIAKNPVVVTVPVARFSRFLGNRLRPLLIGLAACGAIAGGGR